MRTNQKKLFSFEFLDELSDSVTQRLYSFSKFLLHLLDDIKHRRLAITLVPNETSIRIKFDTDIGSREQGKQPFREVLISELRDKENNKSIFPGFPLKIAYRLQVK